MNRRPARTEPDSDGFYLDPVLAQPFGPALPICWAAHSPEDQRLLLEELDVWVTWLAHHYGLDRRHVPGCWTQHWEVIEELSALHLAWEGAFATTAQSDAPLAWHERFSLARARLADWVSKSGCRPGAHRS